MKGDTVYVYLSIYLYIDTHIYVYVYIDVHICVYEINGY